MITDDLLLDILYWMEFENEGLLLNEVQDTDPDEWVEYQKFAEMLLRCVKNVMEDAYEERPSTNSSEGGR